MCCFIIVLTLMSQAEDSLQIKTPVHRNYNTGIIISGLMSAACLTGAGISNNLANKEYEKYKHEVLFKKATNDWNRVVAYDRMRNAFFVGAGFFLAATVYFQVRHMTSAKKVGYLPVLDVKCAEGKICMCIQKHL